MGGNPLSGIDPYGLFDITNPAEWPTVPQTVIDFSAGFGDTILMGQGDRLRNLFGVEGGINKCDRLYQVGALVGTAVGTGRLAYAGLAKAGSVLAASGAEASAVRQALKVAFRGGIGKNWRPPNLSKYASDAEIRAAAGRTNPFANGWWGYGMGAAGVVGSSDCACPSN